jgi:putative ABC transport system substrate-binding protein
MSMIARRRFGLVLAASALTPSWSFAQRQAKLSRVGVLSLDTSASDAGQQALEEFPAAMAKLGYREGSNLALEWRWANGRAGELRELATGLLRTGVDVIVARTNDPIRAAMDATRSVPGTNW